MSPITILEPAPSERNKEVLSKTQPTASYASSITDLMSPPKNTALSINDDLMDKEMSMQVNKKGIFLPKGEEPIRGEPSDSALHDDRVTMIYDSDIVQPF